MRLRTRALVAGVGVIGLAALYGPPASAVGPLAPGTVPTTTTTVPASWEASELEGLGAPVTAGSIQALASWAQSEGVTVDNNPLASSGRHPGATVCLAQCRPVRGVYSPVYAYGTMAEGVAANVAFLEGSNYDAVRAAFRADAGPSAIWHAVNASRWCQGCQGGEYPVYLHRWVEAHPTVVTTTTTTVVGPLA